jgi:hypothetical protein
MTWFEPYNQSDNIVDIYTYSQDAQVYPTFVAPYPTGLNLSNYTRNQTVIINGVGVTYSVDFSGVTNTPKLLGSDGGMYCDNNRCKIDCPNWPYCKAFFLYSSPGCQLLNDGCVCLTNDNLTTVLVSAAPDGGIRYPSRLINPMDSSKARYWNNPNLWYNVFANGYVLIKNDGPAPGELGSEEYVITTGHPLTTSPCSDLYGERSFSFSDTINNTTITRRFVCPCVAWDLPHGVFQNGGWNGDMCGTSSIDPLSLGFTNDGYRLWVMKAGQAPIPDSITRYKVLLGSLPNNQMSETTGWPVYDLDSHMRVSKYLTYKKTNGPFGFVPDRTENVSTFSYAGIANFYVSTFSGQGDDGHPSFTITQDQNPETIFIGWNRLTTRTRSKNIPTICGSVNSLEAAARYYNINDGRNIVVNQECDPGVFNPTLIDGYIEGEFSTDPAEVINGKYFGNAARDVLYNLTQPLLTLYGKPNIVFYQFPGEMYTPDVPFLGNITESNTKYPLRNSPYLSRESINNIFENSNIVAFNEQKMLQAAELNELQEKFYKNQSLSIQFYNNWFTKNNLTQNATDILGISGINFKLNPILRVYSPGANTTTPLNPFSITIFKSPENIYTITIHKDYYRLVSNFAGIKFDVLFGTAPDGKINHNVDYVNILIDQITTIDLNDMTEEEICFINVRIDYGNIITCNDYLELKDNSGDTTNAPCGASRNFLRLAAADPIISTLILKNNVGFGGDITANNLSPVNNQAGEIYPATYLLAYAKKENGVITFYHSNGIKIQ